MLPTKPNWLAIGCTYLLDHREQQILMNFVLQKAKQFSKKLVYTSICLRCLWTPILAGLRSPCQPKNEKNDRNQGLQVGQRHCEFIEISKRSMKMLTFNTPLKILPPATPPLRSSTSHPGLLTSNDRMTINLGADVKSRCGMGIFLVIYSHRTSILYLSCADIGTTGAPSATVPVHQPQKSNHFVRITHPFSSTKIREWKQTLNEFQNLFVLLFSLTLLN